MQNEHFRCRFSKEIYDRTLQIWKPHLRNLLNLECRNLYHYDEKLYFSMSQCIFTINVFFSNKILAQSSYAYFRKFQGKNDGILQITQNFNVFLQVLLIQNSTTCYVNVMPNYAINLKAIQLFGELLLINDSRYCTHFKCKGVKLTVSFFALRKCFCVSIWLFDFLSTSLLHLVVFRDV